MSERHPSVDELLAKYKAMEEGTWTPAKSEPFDAEISPLYGGVSGASLEIEVLELAEGLTVRPTFAHLMAPFVMAFGKPPKPNSPHPAPWKLARGGMGLDINIEIRLEANARPTGFDRMNTLWWALALLRLRTAASIRMPIISSMAFRNISKATSEPTLWTIEALPYQLKTRRTPSGQVSELDLIWVRDRLKPGAMLMDDAHFNRAFQTFDTAIWAHSPGAAILMLWAALETLLRPGRQDIAKKLAASIAALLTQRGPERDRVFQHGLLRLYVTTVIAAVAGAVHGEFSRYNEVVGRLARQLNPTSRPW